MSETTSRRIFIAELFILVCPPALLLFAATIIQVISTFEYFEWYNITDTGLALIACTATTAGLYISRIFLKPGSAGLRGIRPTSWILLFLGVILVLAAGISKLLPPAPEYSREEIFRNDLELFLFGSPLCIPFIHLLLERFVRKPDEISVHPVQRNVL